MASGAVLDAASLMCSTIETQERPVQAELCIRAGFVALRRIADFFDIGYDPDPKPDDAISVRREEFDALWSALSKAGVPLKSDQARAWRDYAGWRVNYDQVIRALATLTMAPVAPTATSIRPSSPMAGALASRRRYSATSTRSSTSGNGAHGAGGRRSGSADRRLDERGSE